MIGCDTIEARKLAKWSLYTRRLQRELGYRVKWARQRADLNQKQLADAVGLSGATISQVERGTQKICVHNLAAIARATKIPFVELIGFIDQLPELPEAHSDLSAEAG